ncbi:MULTISPECIES: hypothetical protein [unclassified Adlercreutzia]|uniref:hypothetical protein n=1 Tax=unclassified Adlercreutzia TaxID=2636013 RepID=UPI0013E9F3A1|nr:MULTISPECIES: hypothetical protein [unclassified Adlercreutzia]
MARKITQSTRVKRLLYRIPAERKEEATRLAEELIYMEDKISNAKQLIGSTGVAISYNNGGGQAGIRENPALVAYQKLWKTYLATQERLDAMREPERQANGFPSWLV